MSISGAAKVAGIFGWPIAHSRSPAIHGYWLQVHGIDGAYVPMAVAPADLADALRALPKLGFVGVNLTVPHKEAALEILDSVDDHARRIGAVNTILVQADGRLSGRNTDATGFIEQLRASVPAWTGDQSVAIVLGAGGAARAVCVALMEAGVGELRLANRTTARAEHLVADLRRDDAGTLRAVSWDNRSDALSGADLLVNTTTLGMTGQPPLDIELAALPQAAVVYDVVYAPLETPLLAAARRRGNRCVDGLGMLLHQARPAFAAWFGVMPDVTPELRDLVLS